MDDLEAGVVINPDEMLSERERRAAGPSHVERTLGSIDYALKEDRGSKPTVYDLLALSNAAVKDATGDSADLKAKKRLHETVVEMAADEVPSDKKEAHVEAYLAEQIAHWEALRDDPEGDAHRDKYQSYVEILSSLQSEFFGDTDVVEEWANVMKDDPEHGEVVPAPAERFPEYVFKADKTAEVLQELREKEDLDIDDLDRYVVASNEDLTEQEKRFDEKNPELRKAIEVAEGFSIAHADEIKEDKLLLVAIPPVGEPQVSWNGKTGNEPGTKYYFFDPNTGPYDSYRLAWHITEQDAYKDRRDRATNAQKLLNKLKSDGETATDEEIFAIQQIIATHMGYIEGLDSGEDETNGKDMETLHKFAEIIESKILDEEDDDD